MFISIDKLLWCVPSRNVRHNLLHVIVYITMYFDVVFDSRATLL